MLSKIFGGGGDAIDVVEAHRRAVSGEVELIDVRERSEWSAGHAPMAKHVPLGSLAEQLSTLSQQGRPIAFICGSGARSGNACSAARRAGIDAFNVKGGMGAWSRAGLATTR